MYSENEKGDHIKIKHFGHLIDSELNGGSLEAFQKPMFRKPASSQMKTEYTNIHFEYSELNL